MKRLYTVTIDIQVEAESKKEAQRLTRILLGTTVIKNIYRIGKVIETFYGR